MTLTAAAATALRGEAALKVRQPKKARKNATIRPSERSFSYSHWPINCQFRLEEPNLPLEGELMQCAPNAGVQRIKRVCVYINKKSQVMIKLKSKHVGGAFSKKIKCVVYGVCVTPLQVYVRKKGRNRGVINDVETQKDRESAIVPSEAGIGDLADKNKAPTMAKEQKIKGAEVLERDKVEGAGSGSTSTIN